MRVDVTINLPQDITAGLGVNKTGDVQRYLTQSVLRHMGAFIPWKTGKTYKNLTKRVSESEILVDAKWARYIYRGVNRFTGGPLNYTKSPNAMAGPLWDMTMMQHDGKMIAAEVEAYARRLRR